MDKRDLLRQWFEHFKNKDSDFNQVTLAQKSGVNQQYISNLLNDKKGLGVKVIDKLCAGMGITVAEFFSGPPKAKEAVEEKAPACRVEKEFPVGDYSEADYRAEIGRIIQYLDLKRLHEVFEFTLARQVDQAEKKNIG